MRDINSVCVYCGSSSAVRQSYKDAAIAFGEMLAKEKIKLVYGGGQVGIMGIIADAVLRNGGEVIGIIPHFLNEKEIGKADVTELIAVDSMHIRKQIMAEKSDGFIVMPGGFGTLDEFFEILTWRQLKLHDKPIVIADIDGYWGPLIGAVDHIVAEGFAHQRNRDLFKVVPTVGDILPTLRDEPTGDTGIQSSRT